MKITAGCLCFVVKTSPEFLGRVVKVMRLAVVVDGETRTWHEVDAEWTIEIPTATLVHGW